MERRRNSLRTSPLPDPLPLLRRGSGRKQRWQGQDASELLARPNARLTLGANETSFPTLTVAIAQLVEPQIVVLVVAGSNPVGHPSPHPPGTEFLPRRLPQPESGYRRLNEVGIRDSRCPKT